MKFFFTKKQYATLLEHIFIGSWVRDILSDVMEDERYMKMRYESDALEDYLLGFAKDFGVEKKYIEVFEGKNFFSDEYYDEHIQMIDDFVDFEFFDGIARRLALRDFLQVYTDEQIEAMDESERISKKYDYEQKYRVELETNGLKNFYFRGF